MPVVKATIHSIASMGAIVLTAVLNQVVTEQFSVFERLSALSVTVLIETAGLPMSEEVAKITVPTGLLVGAWIVLFEVRELTTDG